MTNTSIFHISDIIREASLFMGLGGWQSTEIVITLANHLIFASFFRTYYFAPKESEMTICLKFIASLEQ